MNQKQAAAYFGVDVKTLRQFTDSGVMPAPRGRGSYDVEKCAQGLAAAYIALKRLKAETPPPVIEDSKARLDDLKVQRAEMELAKERREFLPVSVLGHYAAQVGSIVHAAFEALPAQIKQRIPHLRAPEVNLIRELLAKTANQISEFDASDPSGA